MIELEFHGTRHPIHPGEMAVGSDPGSALHVSGAGVSPTHALVQGMPDGTAAIRRADPDATLEVNGIQLGENPTPLLHGDKVRLGEVELLVVDSHRAGSTQFMSAAAFAEPAAGETGDSQEAMTGGRIVCLTDGREYAIGGGLVFGREAGADVVVAGSDVSRRHAEIAHREGRYLLLDHSTNGTFVNGIRMGAERGLARSDVIRIGPEEFRFYAEPASEAPSAAPGADHKLTDTMHGIPLSELGVLSSGFGLGDGEAAAPTLYGSLLVRTGDQKGQRIEINDPVITIGRAAHNDIVIDHSSISASHARLELRGSIWRVSDLDSTNGTFADGDQVLDEAPLAPGATIQLGHVSLLFDPLEISLSETEIEPTQVMGAMDLPETDQDQPEPEAEAREPMVGLEPTAFGVGPEVEAVAPVEPLVVQLSDMDQIEVAAFQPEPVPDLPEPVAAAPDVAPPAPPPPEEEDAPEVEELFAEPAQDDRVTSGQRPVFVSGGRSERRGPPLGLLGVVAVVVLLVVLYFLGVLDPAVAFVTDLLGGLSG